MSWAAPRNLAGITALPLAPPRELGGAQPRGSAEPQPSSSSSRGLSCTIRSICFTSSPHSPSEMSCNWSVSPTKANEDIHIGRKEGYKHTTATSVTSSSNHIPCRQTEGPSCTHHQQPLALNSWSITRGCCTSQQHVATFKTVKHKKYPLLSLLKCFCCAKVAIIPQAKG